MKKLLLLLGLFISFTASAQVYQEYTQHGASFNGFSAKRAFTFPTRCGDPNWVHVNDSMRFQAGLMYDSCAKKLWAYDPKLKTWDTIHIGAVTVSVPTWQEVLTAGSTLTGNNTIAGGGFNWTWNNLGHLTYNLAANKQLNINTTGDVEVYGTSIYLAADDGFGDAYYYVYGGTAEIYSNLGGTIAQILVDDGDIELLAQNDITLSGANIFAGAIPNDNTETQLVTLEPVTGKLEYRTVASLGIGGGSLRFGVAGEDDAAGQDRRFSGRGLYGLELDSLEYLTLSARSGLAGANPYYYLDSTGNYFNGSIFITSVPVTAFDTADYKILVRKDSDGEVNIAPGWGSVFGPVARAAISLTTTGSSGPATYDNTTGVLNVPEYGGASVTFGTDNQIPFINVTDDDFEYNAALTWDGTTFNADGGAVFNEAGADRDFRVESDGQTNMFVTDGGLNTAAFAIAPSGAYRLRIGTDATVTGGISIETAESYPKPFSITTAFGEVGYFIGTFQGMQFVSPSFSIADGAVAITNYDASFGLWVNSGGGSTVDFKVSGDNDADLFTVDVSADRVGIGTASPQAQLHTTGTVRLAGIGGAGLVLSDADGDLSVTTVTQSTYTPTTFNTTNIAASTPGVTHYLQIGDWVHVWGTVAIDATTALTISEMGLSLPISTGMGNVYDLAGTATFEDNTVVQIKGDVANARAVLRFTPQSATNNTYSFHFSFKYIAP